MITATQRRELLGLALLALAVFMALSLVPVTVLARAGVESLPSGNLVGVLGAIFHRWGVWLLGAGITLVPILPALGGTACFGWPDRETAARWLSLVGGCIVLVPTALALAQLGLANEVGRAGGLGGWLGLSLAAPLVGWLGWFGAALALVFAGVGLSVATVGWNPLREAARAGHRVARSGAPAEATPVAAGGAGGSGSNAAAAPTSSGGDSGDGGKKPGLLDRIRTRAGGADTDEPSGRGGGRKQGKKRAKKKKKAKKRKGGEAEESDALILEDPGDPDSSARPPVSLLTKPPARDPSVSESELDRQGETLVDTLKTFKIGGEIADRTTGPVITQFEFVPAPGIKVNRIASLDADLALALKAPSVRIVAPIPGKGAVGVEVPNPEPEVVNLRGILGASTFQRSGGTLPLALGKDLTGRPYVADLARMPHLLIAGATGSGKSVCINTLITSLIYRFPPQKMRMLLVDPKMVELSMYSDLPHLRHSVVTDPEDAATVLKWAVLEMERRYALLSENGARSLDEFNRRVEKGRTLRAPEELDFGHDVEDGLYVGGELPYIVVVVDELADLMMAVQSEIEQPLARLAQKARAVGIHLIVATQRPSVNVITGLIKANFPSRIAFRVSSKVDSRTILDQNGADSLLGNGDMLFLPPGQADPIRIQGAFVSTEDSERIMQWYRKRGEERPSQEQDILELVRSREEEAASENVAEQVLEDRDALFRQAAEICVQHEQGSTSLLQRRLRIGYGRAARIVDQLHHAGVLGPPAGSKPRDVLVGPDSLADIVESG